MRISRKLDYALRAVLHLASRVPPGEVAPTSEIARRIGAPPKFLEAILAELRRAGLVQSERGADGGHRLARSPHRVTAGEVWRAIDGPLSIAERLPRRRPALDGAARAVQGLWAQIEEVVVQTVNEITLEELASRAQQASNVLDFSI